MPKGEPNGDTQPSNQTATSRHGVCAARLNILVGRDQVDTVVACHRLRQVGAHVERKLDHHLLGQAITARGSNRLGRLPTSWLVKPPIAVPISKAIIKYEQK